MLSTSSGWPAASLSAMSLLAIACTGCYGPTKSLPDPRPAVVEEESPTPPAVQAKPPLAKHTAKPAAAAKAEPEPPSAPVKRMRPPRVTDWTLADLLTAREEADPLLHTAVAHHLKTSPRDDATLLLATLLLPKFVAPPKPIGDLELSAADRSAVLLHRTDTAPSSSTAAVIIEYLAASDRPLARRALEDVLRGQIKTDLPSRTAAELVLAHWCNRGAEFYEPLFLEIITAPHRWRAPDDADLPADALQLAAFELIRSAASADTRTRLAEYLVSPAASAMFREPVGSWLAEAKPENIAAQVVLHNSDLLSPDAKTRFRNDFAARNAAALDVLLGMTPVLGRAKTVSPAASKPAASSGLFAAATPTQFDTAELRPDDAWAWELAQRFWSDAFVASVAADLSRMADIGTQRELMLLACNLPKDAVREQLYRALHRQWVEGAAPFMAAKLTFDSTGDPGFLPLVKLMPREANSPEPNVRPAIAKPAGTASLSPETKAKRDWMAASERFVRTVNARCFAAARASQSSGTLPIELHHGADVVAEYHLNWPDEAPDDLDAKPDALVVHYVRMEGEERLGRLINQYKRQLERPTVHTTAQGQWLDSISQNAASGRLRSVDIMLTRNGSPPRNATVPEPLVIEVLWIEIADPT